MLEWSVASLHAVAAVTQIVIALPADELDVAPEGTMRRSGGVLGAAVLPLARHADLRETGKEERPRAFHVKCPVRG